MVTLLNFTVNKAAARRACIKLAQSHIEQARAYIVCGFTTLAKFHADSARHALRMMPKQ